MRKKEPYVYDPTKLSEKIGDFCEHTIAGFIIGAFLGFWTAVYWLLSIQ